MKTSFTSGLDPEIGKEIEAEFKHSARFRERLIDILMSKNESNRSNVRQKTSYERPSWAYEQADAVGYERAIYEVISLISSESVEKSSKSK